MDESLTQQRRVSDEGLRIVKLCQEGRNYPVNTRVLTVPPEEAPANFVPAAAVIRGERVLFGFIGRKGSVGGNLSQRCNSRAQPWACL